MDNELIVTGICGSLRDGSYTRIALKIALKYNENAFSSIAIAGFTPIPFKVFTIAAGVFHVNLSELFFASLLSRGARFFLLSGLIYRFGPSIKLFIDRYFNKLAVAFVFLLFLGFFAVRYLF